jgi:hypothetical protein
MPPIHKIAYKKPNIQKGDIMVIPNSQWVYADDRVGLVDKQPVWSKDAHAFIVNMINNPTYGNKITTIFTG